MTVSVYSHQMLQADNQGEVFSFATKTNKIDDVTRLEREQNRLLTNTTVNKWQTRRFQVVDTL